MEFDDPDVLHELLEQRALPSLFPGRVDLNGDDMADEAMDAEEEVEDAMDAEFLGEVDEGGRGGGGGGGGGGGRGGGEAPPGRGAWAARQAGAAGAVMGGSMKPIDINDAFYGIPSDPQEREKYLRCGDCCGDPEEAEVAEIVRENRRLVSRYHRQSGRNFLIEVEMFDSVSGALGPGQNPRVVDSLLNMARDYQIKPRSPLHVATMMHHAMKQHIWLPAARALAKLEERLEAGEVSPKTVADAYAALPPLLTTRDAYEFITKYSTTLPDEWVVDTYNNMAKLCRVIQDQTMLRDAEGKLHVDHRNCADIARLSVGIRQGQKSANEARQRLAENKRQITGREALETAARFRVRPRDGRIAARNNSLAQLGSHSA